MIISAENQQALPSSNRKCWARDLYSNFLFLLPFMHFPFAHFMMLFFRCITFIRVGGAGGVVWWGMRERINPQRLITSLNFFNDKWWISPIMPGLSDFQGELSTLFHPAPSASLLPYGPHGGPGQRCNSEIQPGTRARVFFRSTINLLVDDLFLIWLSGLDGQSFSDQVFV